MNSHFTFPRCSMYGIFKDICPKNHPNVSKYSRHGASGIGYTLKNKKNTLQSKALTNKIAWFATPDTSLQSGPEMAAFLGTVYRERFELRSKWDQHWAQESQVPRIKSFDIFWNHLKAGKAKHDQLYQDRTTWSHVALITWSNAGNPIINLHV
jgi:hypothetical protein